LEGEVKVIIDSLAEMSVLVRRPVNRSIPFCSGQNIKPLTLCNFAYFELLLQCLLTVKDSPEKFALDMNKLDLFVLIQKYLS
jgi:hypothetical protein